MAAAHDSPQTPRQVGVYRLEEKIGSGAMGTVYRATHTTLGKEVALKLVRADDPEGETCQRFLQEGVAASRVRHPNVVEVLDAGKDGDNAFMAMQLLEGETLAECLGRGGRLQVTYAVDLILPVCAALMAAHEAGVLHRDLKPANIFLTDVGRGEPEPMLLDFGISKILGPVDAELTQNPRFLGTPLYIAPEQADGAPGSPFSDQYSLALSLYECLLGVRPFEKYKTSLIQLLRHVAEGDIRSPRDLDASIPEDLDDAICRALKTDPGARFPSMREFGAALLPFASAARRALWEHSFVDTERTMTSASAPIDSERHNRKVHVSVDESQTTSRHAETRSAAPSTRAFVSEEKEDGFRDDFISHSKLFNEESSPDSLRDSFRPDESSISVRGPSTRQGHRVSQTPPDPFSQAPSGLPVSDTWAGPPASRPRNSVGVPVPDSWRTESGKKSPWIWLATAVLAIGTIAGSALLLRYEMQSHAEKSFAVQVAVSPPGSELHLDERFMGTDRFEGSFLRDGTMHTLRVSHPGFEPTTVVFTDQSPPKKIALKKLTKPSEKEPAVTPVAEPKEADAETSASQDKPAARATSRAHVRPRHPGTGKKPVETRPESPPEPSAPTQAKIPESSPAPSKPESIPTGNLDPWSK